MLNHEYFLHALQGDEFDKKPSLGYDLFNYSFNLRYSFC